MAAAATVFVVIVTADTSRKVMVMVMVVVAFACTVQGVGTAATLEVDTHIRGGFSGADILSLFLRRVVLLAKAVLKLLLLLG